MGMCTNDFGGYQKQPASSRVTLARYLGFPLHALFFSLTFLCLLRTSRYSPCVERISAGSQGRGGLRQRKMAGHLGLGLGI